MWGWGRVGRGYVARVGGGPWFRGEAGWGGGPGYGGRVGRGPGYGDGAG